MSQRYWSDWVRKSRVRIRPRVQRFLASTLTSASAFLLGYALRGQPLALIANVIAIVAAASSVLSTVWLIRWGWRKIPPFSRVVESARCTAQLIAAEENLIWYELQMVAEAVVHHLPLDKPLRQWWVYSLLEDLDRELHSQEEDLNVSNYELSE